MEFHQNTSERFAEKIITLLSTKFDGKVMNSPEMTIELMIKSIPYESEDDIIDISPTPEKVINTVKPANTDELVTRVGESKKRRKKETSKPLDEFMLISDEEDN